MIVVTISHFQIIVKRVNCNSQKALIQLIELIYDKEGQTMIPYLCGGTFLTQVLRVTERTTKPTDRLNGKKEDIRDQDVFRRLLSIYGLADLPAPAGDTQKTYASDFKQCKDSKTAYTKFTDSDYRQKFDADVRSGKSKALYMVTEFVKECIDVKRNGTQLVRCILGMIKDDKTVKATDEFFIFPDGGSMSKQDILTTDNFFIEPFLLGVWHYIIMKRAEKNELGSDTYKSWYPKRDDYRGTVGSDITMPIKVKSANVEKPIETEETFEEQGFTTHVEQGQTVNNYFDIKIKNNVQNSTIQNLTLN